MTKVIMENIHTTRGPFTLRTGQREDVETMLYILQTTARQMVLEGLNQWTPELFSKQMMASYLADREVFILNKNEDPAGMFTLQDSDPDYWGDRNDSRFIYLHRLAVLPVYRGLRLGHQMIDFAQKRAGSQGKLGLRLDCVTHLLGLNEYYRKQGFVWVAPQDMGGRVVNLYEKRC